MPTVQHLRENSKSALTKRGTILKGNAARMQTGNLYRVRLLLFDKCKFTKPFQWKKCWTRQTTHWPFIYPIYIKNLFLAISCFQWVFCVQKVEYCFFRSIDVILHNMGSTYRTRNQRNKSHFGTCMCSNVETNLSWTCLVSGPLNFEHPSVLLVCSEQQKRPLYTMNCQGANLWWHQIFLAQSHMILLCWQYDTYSIFICITNLKKNPAGLSKIEQYNHYLVPPEDQIPRQLRLKKK